MEKIKFKKIIFDLVESTGNDMELGQKVRKFTNEYIALKNSKKEVKSSEKHKKDKKSKLPKVDKNKIDNHSKKIKLKPMPDLTIKQKKITKKEIDSSIKRFLYEVEEYLSQFDLETMNLLQRAIENNFMETRNEKGFLVTEDYKNSFEIHTKLVNILSQNLYDVQDTTGSPKAIQYAFRYFEDSSIVNNRIIIEDLILTKILQLSIALKKE